MKICARCDHSTTQGVSTKASTLGLIRCNGFLVAAEVNVAWDGHCKLYRTAKPTEAREQFILKFQRGNDEANGV